MADPDDQVVGEPFNEGEPEEVEVLDDGDAVEVAEHEGREAFVEEDSDEDEPVGEGEQEGAQQQGNDIAQITNLGC